MVKKGSQHIVLDPLTTLDRLLLTTDSKEIDANISPRFHCKLQPTANLMIFAPSEPANRDVFQQAISEVELKLTASRER